MELIELYVVDEEENERLDSYLSSQLDEEIGRAHV